MRRRLLVLEASIQRLQLQRDIGAMVEACYPRTLMAAIRRRLGPAPSMAGALARWLVRAGAADSRVLRVLAVLGSAWSLFKLIQGKRS